MLFYVDDVLGKYKSGLYARFMIYLYSYYFIKWLMIIQISSRIEQKTTL